MFWPLGKGRQSERAFRAVNAVSYSSSEPKCSTCFAYLKFQAQVFHFVFSKAHSSPGEPQYFQRSEGLAQVAMKRRHPIRGALSAPSVLCRHLFVVVQPAILPRENSASTLAFFPPISTAAGCAHTDCELPVSPDIGIESLKVIAFDNFPVNWNLSSAINERKASHLNQI
jgi:hypothetical protein